MNSAAAWPGHLLLLAALLAFAPPTPPESERILGTWVCDSDKSWQLAFTKTKCTQHYSCEAPEVDTYTIANTSPQCGATVPVDQHTSYLQLTNATTHETTCYEINGLTAKTLSLRPIEHGGALVFTRK